jgi:hypothetical protein
MRWTALKFAFNCNFRHYIKPGRSVWLSVTQNKSAMSGDLLAALERASSSALFDLDEDGAEGSEAGAYTPPLLTST